MAIGPSREKKLLNPLAVTPTVTDQSRSVDLVAESESEGRSLVQAERDLAALAAENARLRVELEAERMRWRATVESILAPVIEHAPAGLALLDGDSNIVLVNSAFAAASGHTEDQLIGRSYLGLFPDSLTREQFERVRDSGEPYRSVERPCSGVDGAEGEHCYSNLMLAPITGESGIVEGLLLSLVDVTPQVRQRKQVEELAEEANRRLAAMHQLQEQQDDLLRAISHDLRSPLTVVLGHAQHLYQALSRGNVNLRRRHSADAIVLAARQMNSMIQNLVDSARMEAGELELNLLAVQLPAMVQDVKERLAEILDAERVKIVAAREVPSVLADPDRLERIVTNLLSNALKYSDPATEVTVQIALQGEQVVTSVSDRGQGISAPEMSQLFQRYGRTEQSRRRQDSLGLGLYITRGLVEAHGGTIWVESQVGKGSTFHFTLPAAG